ncbi:hypothetical protein [Octadecabacter antarcticus]|uniref:hypothetical protein n=1 Tax=Octadecabacter antarcticus TaxID=1217908 RepID=UPI000180706F|nr:hypothetical protein [Octadecabacter antarcticus]
MAPAGNGIFEQAFTAKVTVSLLLVVGVFILARVAARGTFVRIQIDTASGELRAPVDAVASRSTALFGRVQISFNGIGPVAAGDESLQLIAALRCRLAIDCGLEAAHPMREVILGGPVLAA